MLELWSFLKRVIFSNSTQSKFRPIYRGLCLNPIPHTVVMRSLIPSTQRSWRHLSTNLKFLSFSEFRQIIFITGPQSFKAQLFGRIVVCHTQTVKNDEKILLCRLFVKLFNSKFVCPHRLRTTGLNQKTTPIVSLCKLDLYSYLFADGNIQLICVLIIKILDNYGLKKLYTTYLRVQWNSVITNTRL